MNARPLDRVLGTAEQARERGWEAERRIHRERVAFLLERIDEERARADRNEAVAREAIERLAAGIPLDGPNHPDEGASS